IIRAGTVQHSRYAQATDTSDAPIRNVVGGFSSRQRQAQRVAVPTAVRTWRGVYHHRGASLWAEPGAIMDRSNPRAGRDGAGTPSKYDDGNRPAAGPAGNEPAATMPPGRSWFVFLLILVANYALVRLLFPGSDQAVTVPYTVFKAEVQKENVEAIYTRGESVQGKFVSAVTWPPADEEPAPSAGPRA